MQRIVGKHSSATVYTDLIEDTAKYQIKTFVISRLWITVESQLCRMSIPVRGVL